jgi:hypothetical protein
LTGLSEKWRMEMKKGRVGETADATMMNAAHRMPSRVVAANKRVKELSPARAQKKGQRRRGRYLRGLRDGLAATHDLMIGIPIRAGPLEYGRRTVFSLHRSPL